MWPKFFSAGFGNVNRIQELNATEDAGFATIQCGIGKTSTGYRNWLLPEMRDSLKFGHWCGMGKKMIFGRAVREVRDAVFSWCVFGIEYSREKGAEIRNQQIRASQSLLLSVSSIFFPCYRDWRRWLNTRKNIYHGYLFFDHCRVLERINFLVLPFTRWKRWFTKRRRKR